MMLGIVLERNLFSSIIKFGPNPTAHEWMKFDERFNGLKYLNEGVFL